MKRSFYWAVVPAAGIGKRLGADRPKQYLKLGDRTIIEHTLECLLEIEALRGIAVSVSDEDSYWPAIEGSLKNTVLKAQGGRERCHSVLYGLEALLNAGAGLDDFVMVHDAVRPCVRVSDIQKLMREVGEAQDGGLLAVRLSDTLKRATTAGTVEQTVPRDGLWRALTPQLFELGSLRTQLRHVVASNELVTDEAQAMENGGYHPKLVEGQPDNIKVTTQGDLAIATMYLANQGRL